MENFKEEFRNLLADSFASDKNQWKGYLGSVGIDFFIAYMGNHKFIEEKNSIFKRREATSNISKTDKADSMLVNNYVFLMSCLELDEKRRELFVDAEKIQKNYVEIESKLEMNKIAKSIKRMEKDCDKSQRDDEDQTFFDLNNYYNTLIGYVKRAEDGKKFYKETILSNEEENVSSTNGLTNLRIYANSMLA